MSARTFAVSLGVLALLGLLGFGMVTKGEARLELGEPVPATTLPLLGTETSGSLADYEGQWVLVNVWASWCLPCRDEAPALEAFYREHKDQNQGPDLEVLGVDTQGDNTEEALAFVDEFELSYPQLHDGAGDYAEEELKTTGVPESFLVAPDGTLAAAIPGAVTEAWLRDEVEPRIEAS